MALAPTLPPSTGPYETGGTTKSGRKTRRPTYFNEENHLAAGQNGGRPPTNAGAIQDRQPPVQLAAVGARQDNGNVLHIYSFAVGEGNAQVVITPNNDLFIVDLGSKTSEKNYDPATNYNNPLIDSSVPALLHFLRDARRLGACQIVEGLILSHSDRDHYNYLSILHELNAWVRVAYLGDTPQNYSVRVASLAEDVQSQNYSGNSNYYLAQLCSRAAQPDGTAAVGDICWVTYTGVDLDDPDIPQVCPVPADPTSQVLPPPLQQVSTYSPNNYADPNNMQNAFWVPETTAPLRAGVPGDVCPYYAPDGLTIYEAGGTTIRILVSNYRNCGDLAALAARTGIPYANLQDSYNAYERLGENDPRDNNEASIVTQIVSENLTHLILGDAVGSVEDFLLAMYPTLRNVAYLCIPHHGSDTFNSSSPNFVTAMNPTVAVVSTARFPGPNLHPRLTTMNRYINVMPIANQVDSTYTAVGEAGDRTNPNYLCMKTQKPVIQFEGQHKQIYITGWLEDNYHHYTIENGQPTTQGAVFKPAFIQQNPA